MKALVILSTFILIQSAITLTCVDYNGNSVEWWTIIQVPEEEKNYSNCGHVYFDSTMGSSSDFQYFSSLPDASGTALNNTITASDNSDYMAILWNDEDPITGTTQYAPTAHSKGFIVVDKDANNGYYLLHSFPKYPNVTNGQIDPTIAHGERYYGQSAMCMSASGSELEKIAGNMLIIEADVYWTQSLSSSYPNLYQVQFLSILKQSKFAKQQVPSTPLQSIANITLSSGTQLTMFSKSGNLQVYIFEQIMVPYFQFSMYCETWGNPYWQYAWCNCTSNDYFVKEITEVSLPSNNVYWSSKNDHSKWAIGATSDNPYVCFGDLNKMTAQDQRGGNYMCMQNSNMWQLFASVVYYHQDCQDNAFS